MSTTSHIASGSPPDTHAFLPEPSVPESPQELRSRTRSSSNVDSADSSENAAKHEPHTFSTNAGSHESKIFKEGWLNKYQGSPAAFLNGNWVNGSTSSQQNWKLIRTVIQDGTLKIYKPPSDLGIKAFDTNCSPLPNSASPTHKRIPSASNSQSTSKSPNVSGSRLFFRGLEPHPELEYNERGKIIGGSDEAICHTILFGPSDLFAETSVLLLPLLMDIVSAIDLLAIYSTSVSHSNTNATTIPLSLANHNLTPQDESERPATSELALRLKLVVETFQENFPGMLLDKNIFSVFMRLVESVSYHDDELATELKVSVFKKQKCMSGMLSYATHQETHMWTSLLPNMSEKMSDKLHFILNRVENSNNTPTTSKSTHHHYTNVNSITPISMATTKLPAAIPPSLILDLDVDTFAQQIYHFHLTFSKDWSPTSDISLLFNTKYTYNKHSPLVFQSSGVHFLGSLLIDHVFNPIHKIDNFYRARILTYWINLGNALKNCGDMVGWLAIATVICSISVLRLRSTWCYVSADTRDRVIREWAPVVFDLERRMMISETSRKSTYHVLAPQGIGLTYPKERVVPFFGDLCVKYQEGLTYKQCESKLNSIRTAFERWDKYLEQIPQSDSFKPLLDAIPVIQKMLYTLLSSHYEAPTMTNDTILDMSLEIEPTLSGQYLKHHYTQRTPFDLGTSLPLIFTTNIPSFRLLSNNVILNTYSASASAQKKPLRSSSSRTGTSLSGGSTNSSTTHLSGSSTSHKVNEYETVASATELNDLESKARTLVSQLTSNDAIVKSIRDILNVGVQIYNVSNDIVLKAFENDLCDNSESLLDNSSSTSRRVSSQISSNNRGGFGIPSEKPIPGTVVNVMVKAANLDRLIDILVLGVNDFSNFFNHPENTAYRIDMDAHTLAFFATFRSFCSPLLLLENLCKRFVGARSAAVSIAELHAKIKNSEDPVALGDANFPSWDPDNEEDPAAIDWRTVAQIQIGVLEACHLWVSRYFSDFACDLTIRDQFLELLKTFELELQAWKESGALFSNEYQVYYDTIEALHKKVRKLFIKKLYRPVDIKRLVPTFPVGNKFENLPLHGDIQQLEQLVERVDYVAAEYFNMLQTKDWIEVFDVLELQTCEVSGFFNFRLGHTNNEDDIVIQDVYTFIETLYREQPDNRVIHSLPRPIRELFRLHMHLLNYFTVQIGDIHIKKDERIGRMTSVLKILGIIRTRMSNFSFFSVPAGGPSEVSSYVPAFLESAITAAIARPESRFFANSWTAAAAEVSKQFSTSFNGTMNSIESVIPEIPASALKKSTVNKGLTPCIGWFIERIFEIVCYIPNMSIENPLLINFDKRRYIYNLIVSIMDFKQHIQGLDSLYASGMDTASVFSFTKRIAYLINPVKGIYHLERRAAKDAASREAKEFSKLSSKMKILQPLVQNELEKMKRDSRHRDLIERQMKDLKRSKQKSYSVVGGNTNGAPSVTERKSSRSRFGGLLKAVRPISMALSGSFTPPVEKATHPDDLPHLSTLNEARFKLVNSFNLANITVTMLKHTRERSVFKVTVEGNSKHIFQAVSDAAAESWVHCAVQAQKQMAMLAILSPTSTKVFGVPINIVCAREGTQIPRVVETLLHEIETRGLDEVGLYRIPGSLASVTALKNAFDSGVEVNMQDDRWFDINTVTGCFKLYLRELPEPLLTSDLIGEFIVCGSIGNTHDSILLLRRCVHRLPPFNYNLLKRVIYHLVKVTEHGSTNLMHSVNLAIVFSMSFLPPSSSTTSVSNDLSAMQTMLKTLILAHPKIFSDIQDNDSEGPLPSQLPILLSSHHLGVRPTPLSEQLQPPQPPQMMIESTSNASLLSLDVEDDETEPPQEPLPELPSSDSELAPESAEDAELADDTSKVSLRSGTTGNGDSLLNSNAEEHETPVKEAMNEEAR